MSEDRVRCEHCKSIFPRWASSKPIQKQEPKEPFLERWKKHLTVMAGAAAVLLIVIFGSQLFGNGRVRVHRAHGKADFEGKPMANATIFLHPIGTKNLHFPRPCATVKEDGTFVLGTYGKGDGAPAGEYKVIVQWVVPISGSAVPVNVLPVKYASATTSDLTVRIKSGENVLPPIQFTKAGVK